MKKKPKPKPEIVQVLLFGCHEPGDEVDLGEATYRVIEVTPEGYGALCRMERIC